MRNNRLIDWYIATRTSPLLVPCGSSADGRTYSSSVLHPEVRFYSFTRLLLAMFERSKARGRMWIDVWRMKRQHWGRFYKYESTVFLEVFWFCITNLRTKSMEPSPSLKADSSWASQKVLRISYNFNVRYRDHKSPTFVHVLNQSNSIYTLPFYFSKI